MQSATPDLRRLKGKRALVTGAGQGIGRAVFEAFVLQGADVIAVDRDPELIAALAGAVVLDLTDRSALEDLPARTGPIDILVNAAGIVHSGSILECTSQQWDAAFELNATAMFLASKGFLPGMLERGSGSIINIASVASSIIGVPNRLAYGASKGAAIGLTKALAADYVAQGIRCNAICPGTIDSPSLRQRIAAQAELEGVSHDDVLQAFAGRQPVGRLGYPAEVAAIAVYFAADESAFTTGTTAIVDGGWSLL